jgi:hypothetical protein
MSWHLPSSALAPLLVVSALVSAPLFAGEVALRGRVVDETGTPVPGARVVLRPGAASTIAPPGGFWEARTDPDGALSLTLPGPGDFLVSADREGYYALKDRTVHVAEPAQDLTLTINTVREVFQSANVTAETSPVDVEQTEDQERLTGTEVNDMPYANSHSLRNSMQLVPGVVEDAGGGLHVNGSSENQVDYLLNGFNITNPISGQFQTVLAVEDIRSLDPSSGRTSPEFGKGSAGALNVNTANGGDAFHYTATDFVPGFNLQQGVRLGNWYPRLGVSGPIARGRAWFSDNFDSEYTETLVTGLPRGQDTRSGWAGSNLFHAQVNLSPANILFADFLVNVDNEGRVGLGPLNPVPTTSNVHTREYFGSVKDQAYLGHGVLVEFGYAHNEYSNVQTPQGPNLYLISPQGNSGNYFVKSSQAASRDQGVMHAYLPEFHFAGSHRLEGGADGDLLNYSADFRRTGYEVLGASGQLVSETLFPAPASFRVRDAEFSSWLLDTWRVSQRLQFTLGVRQDWDRRIHNIALSPRLAFAWAPFAPGRTRISGGYSLTHDAVTMDMLGLPFDQAAVTTSYNPDGTPAGSPASSEFMIGNAHLVLPRAANWTLEASRRLSTRVTLTAKYLRRRAADGFAFIDTLAPNAPPSLLPLPESESGGVYQLENLRRDDYDSVQISAHETCSGQYEWMTSYTRSRALSNAVLDPNTAQPLQVLASPVPMPWDAPNRLLAWAYLPLPLKNWAFSVLADMRSGFPFSIREENGIVVGAVDSYRYPLNFDLNLAIERMVTFHGYRFALRGGVDNLTGRANPTAVNNAIGTPQFLQFLGDEGRHFVVRIRFFGRASKT